MYSSSLSNNVRGLDKGAVYSLENTIICKHVHVNTKLLGTVDIYVHSDIVQM